MNGENTFILDGRLFADMVRGGAGNLGRYRTKVNDLNVFPVPDGDTGDNMYMTIDSGVTGLATPSAHLAKDSETIAHSMLLGARGNSGVILSRIFAGIARGFMGADSADVSAFGQALACGVEEAYSAVSVPVEGTILTVYRDAVSFANGRIGRDSSFESYFIDLLSELHRSLERTPELLDVLREAGVVDSGGAGLVYIAEGMQHALRGEEILFESAAPGAAKAADYSLFTEDSELTYGYCTEFLLRLQNSKIPGGVAAFDEKELFDRVNGMGDSVVAFREGSIIKIHVHTLHPGEVLDYFQGFGEFLTLKIENMSLQHSETLKEADMAETPAEDTVPGRRRARKKAGTVAVASGDGVRDMFLSLGTDEVVAGGQSMNPSAEDFIEAFDRADADVIYVLPNNGNIILTARQAASLYGGADIRVIPTKNIGQGYAAMSMFDPSSGDPDGIESDLNTAFDGVTTGFVSQASRDAGMNGISIKAGDYIGFEGDDVLSDAPDRTEAALGLAEKLGAAARDVLILIRGAAVPEEEAEELGAELAERYPRTEIIPTFGGQPVHDYILILE